MRRIEKEAFSGCTGLTGVTIPGSVKEIGESAFSGCTGLTSVTISEGVTGIEKHAFYECTGLTEVTIPASVETIGDGAFISCTDLKRFRALGSPREIGFGMFGLCNALEEAVFPAVERAAVPMQSNNLLRWDYRNPYGDTVKSCLYWDGDGYVRAENVDGVLIIERYSPDFRLLSSRGIEHDLTDYWGGFFIGEEYNFIITGQENWEEDDAVPVVTMTKYSKQWEKLGQGSLYGANTVEPFRAGSLRCAEAGGMLYIHTSHKMYTASDGRNHQANLTFTLRESDMAVTDAQYVVGFGNGYVSHSFDQYILADAEGDLVKLDLGDAYPRDLLLQKYAAKAGNETFTGRTTSVSLLDIPGADGDNTTGVSAGGLGETEMAIVAVWNYNGIGPSTTGNISSDHNPVRNVYFSWTDKINFSKDGTRIIQLTDYPLKGDQSAGIPVLVPTGLDGGYILWEVVQVDWSNDRVDLESPQNIAWVKYDKDGNVGEIHTAPGALSDCQPICVDGKVVWYAAGKSVPTFYTLDESGLTARAAQWQAPEAVKVSVDGALVWWTDAEPFIDSNSRTMVPLRAVAEALGLTVSWDGQAREAVFTDGARTLIFPIGSTEARTGDGGVVAMDTAAVIVSSRTYAPIRYLAEYFGYKVDWDGKTKTVILTPGA